MTVPEDLAVRFSLHTKARIERIEAEHPAQTTVRPLGEPVAGHRVYEASFRRLGENMLTVVHDGGRRTFLEFFVTEPLETLIQKRAAFLVARQQIKDPSKWWDGVYGPYDMAAKVTRTIDDPDIFVDRMVYALTCDDPGLCKAPFLAAKNVVYPDRTGRSPSSSTTWSISSGASCSAATTRRPIPTASTARPIGTSTATRPAEGLCPVPSRQRQGPERLVQRARLALL